MPTTTSQRRVVAIGSAENHTQPQTHLIASKGAHEHAPAARKKYLQLPQVKESTGFLAPRSTGLSLHTSSQEKCDGAPNQSHG